MIETALQAQVRALRPLLENIRATTLLAADELPEHCAVKVLGQWYGFDGVDSKGRMVLWAEGHRDPFFYGPTVGETFPWRELIG